MKNLLKSVVLLAGCFFVSLRAGAEPAQSPIVQLGPAGGIITCVKGTPDDRVVLVGIRDHGIFRSTDGGQSWSSVFMERMQENAGNINDIVFAGEYPLIAYAATDWGLYKTTDGGANWFLTGFSNATKCLAVHPYNSNIVFIGSTDGVGLSVDGGATFNLLRGVGASTTGLAIDPFSATSKDSLRIVAATESLGFFRSQTGGLTWESFNAGLDSIADDSYKHVRSLSVIVDTSSTVSFAAGTLQGPVVFRKGFNSNQWYKIPMSAISGSIGGIMKTAGLVMEGTSANIYIGMYSYDWNGRARPVGNGLLYTTLSALYFPGSNWSPPLYFPEGVDVFSLFVPDSNRTKVYVASSAGLLVSNNSGNNWLPQDVSNRGLNYTLVHNVGIIQNATKKFIFAGTFGGGIYRSQDEGANWERVSNGITNPYISGITTDPNNDRTLYAASVYNIYKSTNGGDDWKELLPGGYVRNSDAFTNDNEVTLRVSPVNSNNLLMGAPAFGLQRSSDGGTTWGDIAAPEVIGNTANIEFDPEDAQTIYFAGGGFYRSPDFGKTWTNISGELPRVSGNDSIRYCSPKFTPGNKNQIYLCSRLESANAQAFTIYRSTTGGGIWLPLGVHGIDISIDRVDPSFLFASGSEGISHSSDAGKTWIRLADPDPKLSTTYLAINDDPLNSNVQYVGSDHGAVRLDYGVLPKLTLPTAFDFGLRSLGSTSDTIFVLSNKSGAKRVLVQLVSMVDSTHSFVLKNTTSSSTSSFPIEAGAELTLQMSFTPQSVGQKTAYVRFQTTDPSVPDTTIRFYGSGVAHHFAAQTQFDFGTVLIGKDTTISVPVSNKEGSSPAVLRVLSQSNPLVFVLPIQGKDSIIIPAGKDTLFRIRFVPPSQGLQQGTISLGVSDEGNATHTFTLQGAGFLRALFSKRVLLDNLHGFVSPFDTSSKNIQDYFSTLLTSLNGAGIAVTRPEDILAPSGYDAVLIAGPQRAYTSAEIDSLQSYVNGGGLLVMMGNSSSGATGILNAVLTDTTGVKWKSDPGMRLQQSLQTDSSTTTPIVTDVVPVRTGPYFVAADQLQFYGSTFLVLNAERADTMLVAVSSGDTKQARVVVGAISPVGSGKIFLLADLNCWSNDVGTKNGWKTPFGLFAKKNLQFALNVFGSKENFEVTLPAPTPKEEYRIISIPYDLSDRTATSVFRDLGPVDPMNWRLFGQWNSAEQRYMEFPTDFQSITRGLGYWLITRGEKNLNFGLANVSAAQDSFSITLQPGWNLIGNPFPYTVSWENSFRPDSIEHALWEFTGKGYTMDSVTMEPFTGYFVMSRKSVPCDVKINPIPVETLAKTGALASTLQANEWMLRVSVSNGSACDADNYVGVRASAGEEWNVQDISEPPTNPSGYVALSFLETQWKRNAGRYAADFREPTAAGVYWDVEVRSDQLGKNISFSCEKLGSFPGGFGTFLVDMKTERVYDAASGYTFTLKNNEPARMFRLIAGTEEYMRQHTNGIPLTPVEYSLEQNFPNPFNPSTEIRYSLSHSGMVRMDVVNVLGQKVKTLVQLEQPIGHYQVTWDGTTDAGTAVSSGVYFYRLTTEGFSSVRRLVLIR